MGSILKFTLDFMLMVSFIQYCPMIVSQSSDNDEQVAEMPVGGVDSLIVNGQRAEKGQFPWMVGLYNDGNFCTASLIAPNLVLTAAHCIIVGSYSDITSSPSSIYGIVGNNNRNGPETRILFNKIAQPGFHLGSIKSGKKDYFSGDIAILWVTENVTLTDSIQLISLTSPGRNFEGENVTAMGWGRTPNTLPENLMFTQLQVEDQKKCSSEVDGRAVKVICANSKKYTGVCFGDSGGPLVYQDPSGVPIEIGVLSFGTKGECGRPHSSDVYTAIADYYDWIIEQVGNNSGITFV